MPIPKATNAKWIATVPLVTAMACLTPIYLANSSSNDFIYFPDEEIFSFETDFLEKNVVYEIIYSLAFKDYFKDIGIPEDYKQFEKDMLE